MVGQVIHIKLIKDTFSIVEGYTLPLKQLKLPDFVESFPQASYLVVKIQDHQIEIDHLVVQILYYNVGSCEFGEKQRALFEQLSTITIISFDTVGAVEIIKMINAKNDIQIKANDFTLFDSGTDDSIFEDSHLDISNYKRKINESFDITIKELKFKYGCVSFERNISQLGEIIEIEVPNVELREEFDAIKNYFSKVLDTDSILVHVNIEAIDGTINSINAHSPEIDKITKELIDNVKFEFVKTTKKNKVNPDIDQSLFTMDEYFDTYGDQKFESNTFYQNDKDLFEDLLQISNTLHYKNLSYLSSLHAHHIMKLRFVHRPFSFIFLIEGDRDYHVIWETLDTKEATYVWHVQKDLQMLKRQIAKINDILNVIKVQGKISYINSSEDSYHRIVHDYSPIVNGFIKWKGELEHILT